LENIKIISFNFSLCRSMPTSAALDVVAKHLNLKFFEVFFGTANFLLLSSRVVGLGAFIFLLNARYPLGGNSLVI
jgi:phosphoglucomutase